MGTSGGFDGDADWMYCLGKGEGPWRSEDESVSADEGGFGTGSFCGCYGALCNRADRDSGVCLCKRYL